jgi:hypothetical protein
MPTPNNNNSITYFELALLAEDVYKENSSISTSNGNHGVVGVVIV